MKAISIHLIAVFMFCSNIFCQSPLPAKNKVYRDESGKLYVNRNTPIYLRLATDPSDKAETYLLKSQKTAEYSNPMYLDTEGYNSIQSPWAVDPKTKKQVSPRRTVIFEVYADSKAPVTRLEGSSPAHYSMGGKTYFGGNYTVRLKGQDKLSGIENIYYSINGQAFSIYSGPLEFKEEKNYALRYYATDKVGNIEDVKFDVFSIDKSAPVSSFQIMGGRKGNIVSADASIILSGEDSLSGVKHIYYSFNNKPLRVYNKPISVKQFAARGDRMSFYAVDNLRNRETPKTITYELAQAAKDTDKKTLVFDFQVDSTPPQIGVLIEGPKYTGKHTFVSPMAKIKFIASDDKSGLKAVKYGVNSKNLHNIYKGPFVLSANKLQHIYFTAEDSVANKTPLQHAVLFLDKYLPNSKISFSGPQYMRRDTLIISGETEIKLQGSDRESGLKEIRYKINNGRELTYSQAISFQKEGVYKLTYAALDRVNNREWDNTQIILLDKTPPFIHHHFSVDSIGNKTVGEKQYAIYPTNTMLFLASTDKLSGAKTVKYTVNGGSIQTRLPITGFTPGNYEIRVIASDVLDNTTAPRKIEFAVEK